jgi:tRNA A-37 threonylcarbamoyl transferase component Bud32/uncharacterized protein YjeT (DUF2065 family)
MSHTQQLEGDLRTPSLVRLVDEVCSRFEAAWQTGPRPHLEQYLQAVQHALRSALLRELLALDLAYRRKEGEKPSPAEYRARFRDDAELIHAVFAESPSETPATPTQHVPAAGQTVSPAARETIVEEGGTPPVPTTGPFLDHPSTAPGEPELPTIPGYEILGKLGEGGMGVVYKARQLAAKRDVALKMILSRVGVSLEQKVRFQIEAEAIARLQHPNIVQLYEVGEVDSQAFFSLEFCDGGSLDTRLKAGAFAPVKAAALAEKLAQAVHYAHGRGVVHRDLKPANVLLTAGGEPKVTDFGLAKRLDEARELSRSGMLMGTPQYMAPEQASGRVRDIGPATDVYSLGAILYECLTGRRLFAAGSENELLEQVRSTDPVPLRRFRAGIPRDLETICLKCLQKGIDQRYATARDLAEDLRRFQAGEPILARPVGRAERVVKWVRRRPAVAGLLTAAVVLAVAALGGIGYALRQDALYAIDSANKEAAHQTEVTKKVQNERDEAEGSAARLLLLPVGHTDFAAPNDIELGASWELAGNPSDRVKRLFLEYALERPDTLRQLLNRRELAVHAAVGLDSARRRQLEKTLLTRLREEETAPKVRTECAVVASEVVRPGQELTTEAAKVLTDALGKEKNDYVRPTLTYALAAVAARMESAAVDAAARRFTDALEKEKDPSVQYSLAAALKVVAARMGPAAVDAMAGRLTDALEKEKDANMRFALARGLEAVAARMGPAAVDAMAGRLTDALEKEKDHNVRTTLALALVAVAAWTGPDAADAAARRLIDALEKEEDPSMRYTLTRALAAVAARTGPDAADAAARRLIDALEKEKDANMRSEMARALAAVVAGMGPDAADAAARRLTNALEKETDANMRFALARALAAVAARLEPAAVDAAAGRFTDALEKEKNLNVQRWLADALAAVAARMGPAAAEAAAGRLTDALVKEKDPNMQRSLADALRVVAAWVEPAAVDAAARRLTDALEKETDRSMRSALAEALGAVAARMGPEAAEAAARRLTDALEKEQDFNVQRWLADALAAVAARMGPAAVDAVAGRLTDALVKEKDPNARYWLAEAMRVVAARMGSDAAEAAARRLTDALEKETDPHVRFALSRVLAAVAARLGPDAAAAAARRLIDSFVGVNGGVNSSSSSPLLVDSLLRLQGLPSQDGSDPRPVLASQAVAVWMSPFPHPGHAAALARAAQPFPSRFTTQQLVDLLKMPTCIGPARGVVLGVLGQRYDRVFADQWDFVEYAEKHLPDIDLKTPPKRPGK